MCYVYILYSEASDKYYVGSSADPWKRVDNHNEGFNTYTSKHRPWLLAAVFQAGHTRGDAVRMERFIKHQKSRRLIEKLLDPAFVPEGILAQLVRVPHLRD